MNSQTSAAQPTIWEYRMQQTIVLATTNIGKIRELEKPLQAFGLRVVGLNDFANIGDIEETGVTFAENALLKASTVAKALNLVAIADDSGLEVDALGGAPGVYSARYAEDRPDIVAINKDKRNNIKLLEALAHVPEEERSARFCCAMAACKPNGEHIVAEGAWQGRILTMERGTNGFGYDPLLFDPECGRTAAEMELSEKMARSHRHKALQALIKLWPTFWNGS